MEKASSKSVADIVGNAVSVDGGTASCRPKQSANYRISIPANQECQFQALTLAITEGPVLDAHRVDHLRKALVPMPLPMNLRHVLAQQVASLSQEEFNQAFTLHYAKMTEEQRQAQGLEDLHQGQLFDSCTSPQSLVAHIRGQPTGGTIFPWFSWGWCMRRGFT